MKTRQFFILLLTIALSAPLRCLAQTQEPFEVRRAEAAFEELPVLNASEILRPEFLAGSHHRVREPVPTYFGANQFTIDSDFGVFEADGNEMLLRRINEINAIARLKEVSRTDHFCGYFPSSRARDQRILLDFVLDMRPSWRNVKRTEK